MPHVHPDRVEADRLWQAAIQTDNLASLHEAEIKKHSSSLLCAAYKQAASAERVLAETLRMKSGELHGNARKAGG